MKIRLNSVAASAKLSRMDARFADLAEVLVGFSTRVKRGDKVLIEAADIPDAMVLALMAAIRRRKASAFVNTRHARVQADLIRHGKAEDFAAQAETDLAQMRQMDCYIGLRGSHNIFESADIPGRQMAAYMAAIKPVLDHRVNHNRWVVLRWPHPAMAQQAMMPTGAFEDFYFRVCTQDYARMKPGMSALKKLMERTRNVHITGPGTDLRFSIEGMPAVPCGGEYNIPDGEVFTAPLRESVEGHLTYNAPTVYQGVSFDNIRFEVERGKITKATSSNTRRLNEILDQDDGARYIGEFAIGFNPHITQPMRDILFDEKIAGSFHFTPGQAYEIADNGNRSQVHWDIVNIQRPDYGGGEIYFDGKLIRKDGIFTTKALEKLNPEWLLGED